MTMLYFCRLDLTMETIEAVLNSMKLESYIDKFHEEVIDLDLLKDLDDNQLKEIFEKIGMKVGEQMKIRKYFQHLSYSKRHNTEYLIL